MQVVYVPKLMKKFDNNFSFQQRILLRSTGRMSVVIVSVSDLLVSSCRNQRDEKSHPDSAPEARLE